MILSHYISTLLSTGGISLSSVLNPIQHRCKAGEPCWPHSSTWQLFNTSIAGRLVATYPSAAVCHTAHYNNDLCTIAKQNWANSTWRTSQAGAYSAILWELGEEKCFINATIDAPCGQGRVAQYSVEAHSVEDIQAAIRFADQHDLYLVVKNTGHDHMGRSSGTGAFAIWTHNMKGREWHESFVPFNAPNSTAGVPAATLRAGEQWFGA
jgi:FAD binding domain